jgi:MtN3 and saliva related transmembrane protein
MSTTTLIGIGASAFTAVSMLPQLFKIIKEKKAENISLLMLAVLFTGLVLWIVYGIKKDDLIIIIANSFSLFINGIIFCLTLKYKPSTGRK